MELLNDIMSTKEIILSAALPAQTKTYKPVSHQELIDLTLESVHQSGFKLESEKYMTMQDGEIANGRYTISNVKDSEMQLQIGWQNSYNKQLTLKFAIGTQILICKNGMVSGDYGAFKKKHVGEIQTFAPNAITEYIKKSGDAFTKMQADREQMKSYEINNTVRAELIGRMFIEDKFITSTQLNIIKKELSNPTHDYGANGSLWELYNYVTYAMKTNTNARNWLNIHSDAHSFFTNVANVAHKEMIVDLQFNDQLNMFENYEV